MADHAYPQDIKDPAVVVDMTYDNDSVPPPPPFSPNDEASEPLLGAHEKVDPCPPSPTAEEPQPRGRGCFFRNRLGRRRCTSEERVQRKMRARKILRRICFLAVLVWLFSAICPMDYDDSYYDDDLSFDLDDWRAWDGARADQGLRMLPTNVALEKMGLDGEDGVKALANCNLRDMVPWKGPDYHETKAHHLRVTFADGNMAANVRVRSDDVKHTMVSIRANVTKVPSRDEDDDEDDENLGLHVVVLNTEDVFDLHIWADKRIPDDDGDSGDIPTTAPAFPEPSGTFPAFPEPSGTSPTPSPWPSHTPHKGHHKHHGKHHRKHHRKHHDRAHSKKHRRDYDFQVEDEDRDVDVDGRQKDFCAMVDVEVVVPKGDKDFTTFDIQGFVLSVDAEDLDTVHFENIDVSTTFGEIKTNALRTDELAVKAAVGRVSIDSVQASTPGSALRVSADVGMGDVFLGVKPTAVKAEEDRFAPAHMVSATTNFGRVDLSITERVACGEVQPEGETVPGDLYVEARSSVGDVLATVAHLHDDQELNLKATAIKGHANAVVVDKFLGHVSASAFLGKAQIIEQADSESVIEYEEYSRRKKAGYKVIEGTGRTGASSIAVHTTFGHAGLAFQ
ncbi:hypothetical protein EC968_006511 [Mortierella alpina]|nr:hypothetical protein EC968_006511 [Mortierella alpina]